MNKSELVDEIKRLGGDDWSKACAERALNVVLQAVINGLKNTGSVQLVGFGTFTVSERAARTGVNPKTKAKINIPASRTVRFRVGSKVKEEISE